MAVQRGIMLLVRCLPPQTTYSMGKMQLYTQQMLFTLVVSLLQHVHGSTEAYGRTY